MEVVEWTGNQERGGEWGWRENRLLGATSELHGLAALQWSICLDSLNRSSEARVMYERLQSHPNVGVSKRARQFVFSFQAMEMMKVTSSSSSRRKTGYQNFFDAFVENKNNLSINETEVEEDATMQALPYVIFLVSPILMILLAEGNRRRIEVRVSGSEESTSGIGKSN
uniref:Uncharacterized protein n=1 Tax=Tanacetum cinerariifolium TaxID=118510 RepID=A0A699KL22_TANCI|nr:hypothetical protein CTI12_AA388440 [Tanacetum cinerariifolium]